MATPKKSVHWGTNNSFSDTASSLSFSSTSSDYSSSTLEYLNSQLIAHGFAPPPGLSLDGVSNANAERVAKCLLELLGQRTNDMARTEDLSTKLRVLQYDYERMQSMHRAAENNAENAEREMNLHKSRLAVANKALHAAEATHKQTSTELQRTRSTLQSIRTAHQTELKKKEREVERMTERWSKVADVQAKLSNVPSGITCANAQVVEGAELLGNGPGVFEVALEQADQARGQLSTENIRLKKLVLRTVNQLHALMYRAYHPENDDDPPEVMMDNLFPLNPPDAAEQRVTMIISNFENALTSISSETRPLDVSPIQKFEPPPNPRHEAEISRLQDTISALRQDIQRLQDESSTHLQEAQSQFEQYVQRHEKLVVVAEHANSQEKEKLNQVIRDLERDRRAVAEEAKKLQKDKATFDAEKSSWEAQMMPIDNPLLPQPAAAASETAAAHRFSPQKQRIQKKAQTKSPARTFKVGKSNRRRAVTTAQVRQTLASPGTRKVVPSYQTEVIPVPAITLTGTSKPVGTSSLSPGKALLTTSFVLPPPSPQASLPSRPMDLGQPIPPPQFLTPFSLSKLPELPSPESSDNPSSHTPLESPPSMDEDNFMAPLTRGYPVAKPHAQRMVHAYSPVKPSPLSRVLVTVNSPDSPSSSGKDSNPSASLGPLNRGAASMPGRKLFPPEAEKEDEEMPLAQQLGIPESPPESLKRKRVNSSGSIGSAHQRHKPPSSRDRAVHANAKTTRKGAVLVRDSHTSSTVARKRGKATSESADGTSDKATSSKNPRISTRTAPSASGPTASSSSKAPESSKSVSQVEKENKHDNSTKRRSTASTSSSSAKASKPAVDGKAADIAAGNVRGSSTSSSSSQPTGTNVTSARARLLAKLPPSSRGAAVSGPRRILVDAPEPESSDKKGSKG